MSFLDGLNDAQRRAVDHHQGPMLVVAGAGSGKTRVITHRIARIVEQGTPPAQILAVSFTNKAAAEMRERMIPLVGRNRADRLWLSTFHSFGVRFLSEETKALGYPSRFVIFDQGDAIGAVRARMRGGRRPGRRRGESDKAGEHSAWLGKDGLESSERRHSAVRRFRLDRAGHENLIRLVRDIFRIFAFFAAFHKSKTVCCA